MSRSRFTVWDLATVLLSILLLIILVGPSIRMTHHDRRYAYCGANLNGIGKGLAHYVTENSMTIGTEGYPWAVDTSRYSFSNTTPMRLGGYSGTFKNPDKSTDGTMAELHKDTPLHVLENLCILVEKQYVPWFAFRCPAANSEVMPRGQFGNREYGFFGKASASDKGTYFIDYAMHWGYDNNKADQPNKAPIIPDKSPPDLVVLADRHGRSMREFKRVDSASDNDGAGWNHGDEGVNVLTLGNNVFWREKVASGWGGNNLYLRDLKGDNKLDPAATTQAIPLSKYDSVLVNPEPMR
ncbi:MAG: hypothetical protein BWX88_01707 [Planctomycetes bacterium ADurb.Bin126]|nr:MAG: hypothetical protein BWX88_01707 [Planctomycetes bacterium ADurb.Bin126]HOD83298.1 hypothetical protein [Phycisphaerae bacterium]HQL73174.1 hypothetical protein [Phycisphaerae bacterium]